MTPRICFQMIVFNDDYVLRQAIEAVRQFGDVVAAEGPVGYYRRQGYTTSTDQTNAILAELAIPTLHGQWAEKDEMCRAGAALIPPDTEFVWVVDADEIWKGEDIVAIQRLLETGEVDSMAFSAVSFYGGFDRVMTGFEANFEVHRIQRWYSGANWATHRPPTVLAPDGRPWNQHRHLTNSVTAELGLRFYHYSYVWPTQMRKKAAYYHDRDPGGTIPNYYEEIYLRWVHGDAAQRAAIERRFHGVHDWRPERRGACYTKEFTGRHPMGIELRLPELRRRISDELLAERA